MRETSFIEQNQKKWKAFEEVLDYGDKDPDKLSELFLQITDDLSYSRTFYPNRSVRVYLNDLAQRVFQSIYQGRKSPFKNFFHFWTEELPQIFYDARRDMLIVFLIFSLAAAIGALSTAMDPEFPRIILGNEYVDMTEANIRAGDPMAVYKDQNAVSMNFGITANNLFVSFLTFVLGVFYGIGSLVLIVQNGIMLGAFQYFFIARGLFWESFLTIWIHGTIEISCIIVAGAAGLTMGRGLAFPGAYTRMRSFQIAARRGMKMMLGIAPLIALAGFFESFLTRQTETPALLRGVFIVVCLIFVLVYFYAYPRFRAFIGFAQPLPETELPPETHRTILFDDIKKNGELLADAFVLYLRYFKIIFWTSLGMAIFYCIPVFLFSPMSIKNLFSFPNEPFGSVQQLDQFFFNPHVSWLPILAGFCGAVCCTVVNRMIIKESDPDSQWSLRLFVIDVFRAALGMSVVLLVFLPQAWLTMILAPVGLPLALIWIFAMNYEGLNAATGFSRALRLVFPNIMKTASLAVSLILLGILFISLLDTGLAGLFLNLINWVVELSPPVMEQFSTLFFTCISMLVILLVFSLFVIVFGLQYYSLVELMEANWLRERLYQIEPQRRIKGLEKEG
jgi:uncharacterized membrane protein SpoIIM required for sporulation